MGFLKTVIFMASLLALPVLAVLIVLYVVTDIIRDQQEKEERGM